MQEIRENQKIGQNKKKTLSIVAIQIAVQSSIQFKVISHVFQLSLLITIYPTIYLHVHHRVPACPFFKKLKHI